MEINTENAGLFRRKLLEWGRHHRRDFAWRRDRTPYTVLISELMLRRTQAAQVVPVFERFMERYPTPDAWFRARSSTIRQLLKPLGLEWRAQDVVRVASVIRDDFAGEIPTTPSELLQLPGVGDYVAHAVACFAAGQPVAIVDVNVARVLGRIFGLRLDGEARRRKEIREAAQLCVSRRSPEKYNYSLLDFAATVCRARSPNCPECPLRGHCAFF